MLGKKQALDNAIAETIDWIANNLAKEARLEKDTDMIDACAKIVETLKSMKN